MINVKLYTPQGYQRSVMDGLAAHWKGSMHFVKSVRQMGKTTMCEGIIEYASLSHDGQASAWIAPTLRQAKPVYKRMVKTFKPIIANANGTDLEITFINGSSITFMSAEQGDNLRGFTVTKYGILIIDEAAYIPDEVFFAVTPFVNAHDAPIMAISTPRFRSGFFYDYFTAAERGEPNLYAYDFTRWKNPYVTPERLEMYRKKMPVNLFRADYLGQWMETTSDLFGDFERILGAPAPYKTTTAGLDWGVGKAAGKDSDSTAMALFNDDRQMVALLHWNDLDATATIREVVNAVGQYHITKLVAETNSIGAVYLDLLVREIASNGLRCQVVRFTTTNDTKRKVIEQLIVDVQNGAVQLLDDTELKTQMSAYRMERTPTGKITYNAAPGYHDDIIMATAFALHAMRSAIYTVI